MLVHVIQLPLLIEENAIHGAGMTILNLADQDLILSRNIEINLAMFSTKEEFYSKNFD